MGTDGAQAGTGLYLYGVARARPLRPSLRAADLAVSCIRYRDLDALVRPAAFEVAEPDEARMRAHQRVIEQAMRRSTVLPLPFGVVFRDRRELIRLLEDQYLVLDEGLTFLDGHYELRVHVAPAELGATLELHDAAQHVYDVLRRLARAALTLTPASNRLLSAAFLVERGAWVEFVERAHDLEFGHAQLTVDVTGPWPAYDFVRLIR